MTPISFDQVCEAVRTFSRDELQPLSNLLAAILENPGFPRSKEDEIDFRLIKEGLMLRIPPPPTEEFIRAFREYKPVRVEGKPISETAIEERR